MRDSEAQTDADRLWVQQIREGNDEAWRLLIEQYEGRLLAYATARLPDRATAEDVVQETFVGFYRSLPNFDGSRSIEAYLYQICSYKLTDHLRRSGRRRSLSFAQMADGSGEGEADFDPAASAAAASSIARGHERRQIEEHAIAGVLRQQIEKWRDKGDHRKLMCIELLVVQGMPNKEVAAKLDISEQQVANYKADFIQRTRTLLARLELSPDIFPELTP